VSAEPMPVASPLVQLPAEVFFDQQRKLVTPRLGEVIRQAGHLCTGIDGRLWRYEEGVYRPDGTVFARAKVRQILAEECRRQHFDEVVAWLRAAEPEIDGSFDKQHLNVGNGVLDWRTGKLASHSPDYHFTVKIPASWEPQAECPNTMRFLFEVLPDDAIEFVTELIGYALYPGNPLRKAVLLVGPGGNGKSVLLRLIVALLGQANCAHVPLQALSENRFASAQLFGKLANVYGDLDARAIHRTDTFKTVTGEDAISAEHKGRDLFSFICTALPLFSANEVPISSDQTEGWFDRWLVVPMERRFEGTGHEDPHLLDKLTTKDELAGLLALAVQGLRTLLARGHFDLPASVRKANEQYRDRLDSAKGFVVECCTVRPDGWVARPVLYQTYRKWCADSGRLPVTAERFNDHLRAAYPTRVTESTRRGNRGWQGIAFVSHREDDQ